MFSQQSLVVENVHRYLSGTPVRGERFKDRMHAGASSTSILRIGQLTRKSEFEELAESSATSEEDSFSGLIGQNPPWYLRGPQTKFMDFVHYESDLDDSSVSEGGLSEDTQSESDDSDSSSSSEEEKARKAVPESSPEAEESEEDADRSQSTIQLTGAGSKKMELPDRESNAMVSGGSSSISLAGDDSIQINQNPKLMFSYKEKVSPGSEYSKKAEGSMDVVSKTNAPDLSLNQRVALYNQEEEQELRNEQSIRDETMKGAGYWKVRKIVKFLKMADAEGTHMALLALFECGMSEAQNQSAIDDTGALEVLVNLLGVDCSLCRISSLRVMDQLMENSEKMGELAMNLGLADEIKGNLTTPDDEEVLAAVQCLMNLSGIKRARSVLRKSGLMAILFQLIHRCPMSMFKSKLCDYIDEAHRRYEIAMGSLFILTFLLRSPQVRQDLFDIGYNSIIVPMLTSKERLVVKAILEGVVMCASVKKYRQMFEINNLIKHVLKHWNKYEELVLRFLYKMSIGSDGRDQMLKYEVVTKVVNFIQNEANMSKNPYGFKYALACLHRMGSHPEARRFFNSLHIIEPLIKILKTGHEGFKLWVVGLLSQLTIFPENWKVLPQVGGLNAIIDLILSRIVDTWLLAYSLKILADVAHGPEARPVLEKYPEVLHYILALLSDDRPMVVRCAAMALVPLTRICDDYAEVLSNDSDAIETLIGRLFHKDESVVSAVCEALAATMTDKSLLPFAHDLGLKGVIQRLLKTDNEALQENVCLLITVCINDHDTAVELGKLGAVERLAEYLVSPNIHVVIASGNALWFLTYEKDNCCRLVTVKPDIVQTLLDYTRSPFNEVVQASLGCLRNIRHMVNYYETLQLKEEIVETVPPIGKFPYHFKPQVFIHTDIEL